jgi:DnaK suppressor protein
MTKKREKELLELKEILLKEKVDVINQMRNLEQGTMLAEDSLSGDDADLASIEQSQMNLSKLGSRLRKKLQKIDYALKKFDDGTYGICEHSGEEIPIARLKVRPFTQHTVEAKEEIERQERKFWKRDESEDTEEEGLEDEEIV